MSSICRIWKLILIRLFKWSSEYFRTVMCPVYCKQMYENVYTVLVHIRLLPIYCILVDSLLHAKSLARARARGKPGRAGSPSRATGLEVRVSHTEPQPNFVLLQEHYHLQQA